MKALRRLCRRLISLATSARDDQLMRAELDEHVAMQTADYVRAVILDPLQALRAD